MVHVFRHIHDWYTGLDAPSQDVVKISAGPIVAVLIFAFTQIAQFLFTVWVARGKRRRVVVGIFKEIYDNVAYGEQFLREKDKLIQTIKDRIIADDLSATTAQRQPLYKPMVAITESSKFYDASSETVPEIRSACLVKAIAYYRSVDDQRLLASAIESPAYLLLTVDDRCGTIDDLWSAFESSKAKGGAALAAFESCYPKRWFKTFKT